MFSARIFPLADKYMIKTSNERVEFELVIEPKTGHIIITSNNKEYKSSTKEMEAMLDSLLLLKEDLFRKYLQISRDLEILIKDMEFNKESYVSIRKRITESTSQLIYVTQVYEGLLKKANKNLASLNKFLYKDLDSINVLIRENTRKIIELEIAFAEINYLKEKKAEIKNICDKNIANLNSKFGQK